MIGTEFSSLNRTLATLSQYEKGLENLHGLWDRFTEEYYSQETRHFAAAPWVPLSPVYAKRKAQHSPGKPLLRVTDLMFESFTKAGAAGGVRFPRNLSLELGSRDPKAPFHQLGTSRMPARPPLAEPDLRRYETIAGEYVAQMVERAAA